MSTPLNQLLHEPPIATPIVGQDGAATPVWQRYMTNQRAAFNEKNPIVTLKSVAGIQHVSLSQATHLTTAQRDSIENVNDGIFIYNTTTNKFNFREGGTWKEIT